MPVEATPQELMTLSGIAYGRADKIADYLADTGLATGGRWVLTWIAQSSIFASNFAFIVEDKAASCHAIVIRGTYPNPLAPAYWSDAGQDSPFGEMVDWPYPADAGAKVSAGTWEGFNGVLGLVSPDARSFPDAVERIASGSRLYVTGHSLGGTLAPVIAQWLKSLAGKDFDVEAVTFAGLSPGNKAFADLMQASTQRYWNNLDSVPYGWDRVIETQGFYTPSPKGGELYQAAVALMAGELEPYGYTRVGTGHELPGVLGKHDITIPFVTFLIENLHQHLPDTYLSLMGAPPLPFAIGFGACIADKSAVAGTPLHKMPVRAL